MQRKLFGADLSVKLGKCRAAAETTVMPKSRPVPARPKMLKYGPAEVGRGREKSAVGGSSKQTPSRVTVVCRGEIKVRQLTQPKEVYI